MPPLPDSRRSSRLDAWERQSGKSNPRHGRLVWPGLPCTQCSPPPVFTSSLRNGNPKRFPFEQRREGRKRTERGRCISSRCERTRFLTSALSLELEREEFILLFAEGYLICRRCAPPVVSCQCLDLARHIRRTKAATLPRRHRPRVITFPLYCLNLYQVFRNFVAMQRQGTQAARRALRHKEHECAMT